MPVRLHALVFDTPDAARSSVFWSALLHRTPVVEPGVEMSSGVADPLLTGPVGQLPLRFRTSRAALAGPYPLHLHVTSDLSPQSELVAEALVLGARHVDVGQRPDAPFVVLADPAGRPFCVIEAGNSFLAGCGVLGEVACDGSRTVGLFWSAVLDWPLVWDEDQETAIQSPVGGTKISWGGEPAPSVPRRNRQRLELTVPAAELADEIARIEELGATAVEGRRDRWVDPDGSEFVLGPS